MSDQESGCVVLMKFGQAEHLEAFRSEGLLYMNSLRYFAKLEGDAVRSDPLEGFDEIHQAKHIVSLRIEAEGQAPLELKPHLSGPFRIARSVPPWNVFCMHGVTTVSEPLVDERNLAFGDSFVIVTDTMAFLNRFAEAATAAKLQADWRPVAYFDPLEHTGDVGPFRKSSEFAYQREFRLGVWPGSPEPVILRVGDLTDITSPVLPLAEINRIVRITPGDGE